MTTMVNMFSLFDLDDNKNINEENNALTQSSSSSDHYDSPALNQGKKFKKYQYKIQKHLEQNIDNVNSKEGFSVDKLQSSNNELNGKQLTTETSQILSKTNIAPQQQTMNALEKEYNNTLAQYEKLTQQITGSATTYLDRVNSNNPYLGKNIQIGNKIMYVTKQGVAKLYPTTNILNNTAGQNGCPPASQVLKVNIPWSDSYATSGATIPTKPSLISGTPMVLGQSCGNEGTNVFVNEIMNPPTSKYVGCYADNATNPLMTYIGGTPPLPTAIRNGNFSQQSIANNSFQPMVPSFSLWTYDPSSPNNSTAWLINNSTAWGYPIPYPSGNQAACIQGLQSFGQSIYLQTGSYNISFYACGRPGYNGANTINLFCGQSGTFKQMPTFLSFTAPTTAWKKYNTTLNISNSGNYILGFYGTINNVNNSTAIQNVQLNSGNQTGNYNYQQCQQAAIDSGYQYFALQNVNPTTAQGYCAVTNDLPTATKLGQAMVPSGQTPLWSSKTQGQVGNTAILSVTGALSVLSSSGQSVFNTPNSTAQPGNYLGCYGDGPNRAMPFYNNGSQQYNLQQCQQIAQQTGNAYFGLQNSTSGTTAQCAISNNWAMTSEYGTAGNCTKLSNGTYSGGGWSNAVYNTSVPNSNYYLILQDDNNLCIYRGTGPNDNQGLIWNAGTNGKAQQANTTYAAANGKYGQNWISSGSTLASGDFVGSTNGNIALIMQNDGNLVLYTFQNVINCQKMSDGNTGGGVSANALYNIGQVGVIGDIGKLAYIDENAELHAYPSSNSKNTNSYTTFTGMDSNGNDIPNASYGKATVQQCQATCNAMNNCSGFAFSNNVCYPKNSGMYPNGSRQLNPQVDLYMRNAVPKNTPIGVQSNTNSINTISYKNFVNGGSFAGAYGLAANISPTQQKQLEHLEDRIKLLSQQMAKSNDTLNSDNYSVTNQTLKNMQGLGNYVGQMVNTKSQIQQFNKNNMDNIVEDSDITVLQQNYNYLFWSILATGTVLVSMNMLK
jgi:hypothetical protein